MWINQESSRRPWSLNCLKRLRWKQIFKFIFRKVDNYFWSISIFWFQVWHSFFFIIWCSSHFHFPAVTLSHYDSVYRAFSVFFWVIFHIVGIVAASSVKFHPLFLLKCCPPGDICVNLTSWSPSTEFLSLLQQHFELEHRGTLYRPYCAVSRSCHC